MEDNRESDEDHDDEGEDEEGEQGDEEEADPTPRKIQYIQDATNFAIFEEHSYPPQNLLPCFDKVHSQAFHK